jgi:NAD(P)-dependent dehydrogenase (short-subunit alcohol dehydrogenase family)
LIALTRSLALEWAPKVRVNQVSVGILRTERVSEYYGRDQGAVEATIPMGRMATPADVAAMCMMLTSPAAAYVTGADVMVDGGGEEPAFLQAVVPHEQPDNTEDIPRQRSPA